MDRQTHPSISSPRCVNLLAILSGCILAVWPIFINTSLSHLQARCGTALRDMEGRSAVYQASVPSMSFVEVTTAWALSFPTHKHTHKDTFIHTYAVLTQTASLHVWSCEPEIYHVLFILFERESLFLLTSWKWLIVTVLEPVCLQSQSWPLLKDNSWEFPIKFTFLYTSVLYARLFQNK